MLECFVFKWRDTDDSVFYCHSMFYCHISFGKCVYFMVYVDDILVIVNDITIIAQQKRIYPATSRPEICGI